MSANVISVIVVGIHVTLAADLLVANLIICYLFMAAESKLSKLTELNILLCSDQIGSCCLDLCLGTISNAVNIFHDTRHLRNLASLNFNCQLLLYFRVRTPSVMKHWSSPKAFIMIKLELELTDSINFGDFQDKQLDM